MLAAKFAHGRFAGSAPHFPHPKRRNLLTEKQIERKKERKEERVKEREKERKKRQEAKNNELNTTTTNITSDLPSSSPTTATLSVYPSLSPTLSPTFILTVHPSSTPSETPTTDTPSVRPSSPPSSPAPTLTPSSTPSASPTTSMPSSRPSEQASDVPTEMPSGIPSEMPSNSPTVQTTISCNEEYLNSGLSLAIIRFDYQIEFKPSVMRNDAIDHVDESTAQIVADAFLPCLQPSSDRKLNESGKNSDLFAVDSLPKDAVSTTETCTASKSTWDCVVVLGAVTAYTNDLAQFDTNAVLGIIETSSLEGDLNLPGGKSLVTYLSPTVIATEAAQQAPTLPINSANSQEQSPSNSRSSSYVIAVSAAFVGSVAFAFLVHLYRKRLPRNDALRADREGNLQPPEHQEVAVRSSQYGTTAGDVVGGEDAASYLSEDTFWRSIVSKRPRASFSNYQPNNARCESDASIALSSIGASFKGALGLEDDIDIESCGSSTIDEPSCLADVAASYNNHSREDGRGKKWIDRLGIFADPK